MNVPENGNASALNWTINATNSQHQEIIYKISTATQITNAVISVLTVVLNCAMIRCLQTNQSKIPQVIFHQLMSLSVSDVISGLTPVLSCLTLIESINRSSKACVTVLALFSIAQYAMLLNLCVLSFRRWLVLRKADQPSARTDRGLLWTIVFTLCSWLVSGLFSAVVSSIAVTGKSSVNGCLSPDLLDNTMALKSVTVTYFGTLFLLNVFNITSAMILKRLNEQRSTSSRTQNVQQRAFRHLLAVLMVANVTTLPVIVLSVTLAFQEDAGPDDIYAVSAFQALNSLINPILYSAHINEIRDAVKARLVSFFRRKQNVNTRNETNENTDKGGAVYVMTTTKTEQDQNVTIGNEAM